MAQSTTHSRWEVGLDFCLSVLINLGVQAVFVHTFTLSRGLSFTGTFMTLAMVRRYLMRRGFNRFVPPNAGQSRGMSLLEAGTDTVLAVVMAFGMVALWYPSEPLPRVSALIVVFYCATMLRRYLLRRFFEWLERSVPSAASSSTRAHEMGT
jgi:hypothetical protein